MIRIEKNSTFAELLSMATSVLNKNYIGYSDPQDAAYISSSISRKSKRAIMQFPVITVDSVCLEDINMVNKALEREYATFLRIAMGLDDTIKENTSKLDYLKRFHTNGYADARNNYMYKEDVDYLEDLKVYNEDGQLILENLIDDIFNKEANIKDNSGLRLENLNDMTIKNNSNLIRLNEARITRDREETETTRTSTTVGQDSSRGRMTGSNTSDSLTRQRSRGTNTTTGDSHAYQRGTDDARNYALNGNNNQGNGANGGGGNPYAGDRDIDTYTNNTTNSVNAGRNNTHTTGINKSATTNNTERKSNSSEVTKVVRGRQSVVIDTNKDQLGYGAQLVDNDVKKANELIPTTIDVHVYRNFGDGDTQVVHILFGVKTICHKVPAYEMINTVVNTINNKRGLFRFIQWTTGEIKFFKDYLLNIDEIRENVKNSKKNKGWFTRLRDQSILARIKRSSRAKNQIIPNSTFVLTMNEVEFINNTYNINLLNENEINKIISAFNLLGFVIVDNAAEVVYFAFDGMDDLQTYSYRELERENRNQGNDIKSLVSVMNKIR